MRNKVTLEDLKAKIVSVEYVEYIILSDNRKTIAHVTLVNGFSVRGESSCVNESNYNKELSEKIALEKAMDELWKLEAYLLAEEIYQQEIYKKADDFNAEQIALHMKNTEHDNTDDNEYPKK